MKRINFHSCVLANACVKVVELKSVFYTIIRSCVHVLGCVVVCSLSVKRVNSDRVGLYWEQWHARRGAMFKGSHLWYAREGKRQGVKTPPGHS